MAAMAAVAINTGCSDPGNGGEGGTGGTTDTGGTGGTGSMDNCADLKLEDQALAAKRFEPGEVGSFVVDNGGAYDTTRFEMVDGDVLNRAALVGLVKVTKDNYESGYTAIGDVSGVRPILVDPDQPYVEDENGGCELNVLPDDAINQSAMSDPSKLPMMDTPTGVYSTVFCVENGQEIKADYVLTAERTRFSLASLTTANNRIEFFMANSKPNVMATAFRDMDGHVVVDLGGTTDEEDGSSTVLNKLGLSASGLTFLPVDGQPGQFRTANPSVATSLNLDVAGLNQGMVDDTSSQQVTVNETDPCADVNCNGNGTCVNGACVCDAGFANDDMDAKDDCDGCDTQSGLYENDYPVCSPDTTPPNAPVITTNGGSNMIINQANYVLEGNTDADTWTMWYNIDGGPFNQIGGYPSNSINWLYNGNIPAVFQDDNACFQARDKAGNQSATDCITVSRVQ